MNLLKDFDGSIDQSGKTLMLKIYAGIGDLLWRTTLFREIKKRNPNIKLVISSHGPNWKHIYKNNPYIDELRDIKDEDIDLEDIDEYVSDQLCPHVVTSYGLKLHAVDALAKWAGIEIYDKSYWYKVTEEEDSWAKSFLNKFRPNKIIGIGLKASTWVRTWPLNETKRLIKFLISNNIYVVVFDNYPMDLVDDRIISMAGGYNIREIAAVIKNIDALVTPDTGILHFGGHFKIPTVSIFGGTDPDKRIRYYTTVVSILSEKRYKCWPCFLHASHCPLGTPAPCLIDIKAERVFKEVDKIL